MRISRKKRPEKPLVVQYVKNRDITAPRVLVIDDEGNNLGVLGTPEAIAMAEDKGMDLIMINPKSEPPATKIVDFSEFKYQKEKEIRKQKAHSHTSEVKGIRLSVRIGDHDLEVKCDQAQKFLDRGDKVKIELILRGREHGKLDLAYDIIKQFMAKVGAQVTIRQEQEIQRQDHKLTAIIAKK